MPPDTVKEILKIVQKRPKKQSLLQSLHQHPLQPLQLHKVKQAIRRAASWQQTPTRLSNFLHFCFLKQNLPDKHSSLFNFL